jgi:vacuolar-type H+-ATPase subunit I/STV1
MKSLLNYLFVFILGGIVSAYIGNINYSKKINALRKANDSLAIVFKNLEAKNDSIDNIIKLKNTQIDSLKFKELRYDSLYKDNKKQIDKLKKKHEKVNRVDNFNSNDIHRYFTDSL